MNHNISQFLLAMTCKFAYGEVEDGWAHVVLDVQRRFLAYLDRHIVSRSDNLTSAELDGGESWSVKTSVAVGVVSNVSNSRVDKSGRQVRMSMSSERGCPENIQSDTIREKEETVSYFQTTGYCFADMPLTTSERTPEVAMDTSGVAKQRTRSMFSPRSELRKTVRVTLEVHTD